MRAAVTLGYEGTQWYVPAPVFATTLAAIGW